MWNVSAINCNNISEKTCFFVEFIFNLLIALVRIKKDTIMQEKKLLDQIRDIIRAKHYPKGMSSTQYQDGTNLY